MNLSRRVFDDISQRIGSRENPTPLVRLRRLPNPGNAFKYASHYAPRVSADGVPALEVTA